jgi:hypothetical protein
MPDIRNPHDKFFRATFARHYLPLNVVETLDLETLQPAKDSFIFLLKHIFDQDWPIILPQVTRWLKDLAQAESGLAYVEQALRYLAAAARTLRREGLEEAVAQAFPKTGGALTQSLADDRP